MNQSSIQEWDEGLPIPSNLKIGLRNDLLDDPDQWHEADYAVYQSPDESLVLVHPNNPKLRLALAFSETQGQEGYPQMRFIRGFELALDQFYSPPQWPLHYEVERVRSIKETQGVGRVENVTGEYAHVDDQGVRVDNQFDVLMDAQGGMVKILVLS